MTPTDHPLTESRAAVDLWEERCGYRFTDNTLAALRAAFDAGREHEREHADPHHDPRPWQDCTVKDIRKGDLVEAQEDDILHVGVAYRQDADGDWWTKGDRLLTNGDHWTLRRIPAPTAEKDTPMTETTPAIVPSEPLARTLIGVPEGHGAPHHDVKEIKADDYVMQADRNGDIRHGIAHHQDRSGDWATEDGEIITWDAIRADRPDAVTVWPAPTPPAEVVELPSEHPAHLLDVELRNGDTCAYLAIDSDGYWIGVGQDGYLRALVPDSFAAFALPDGTRARRDGEHENGTPRFVKEDQ